MNKKEFEKVSGRMYKNLMKNPNWESYELGLEEGRKQGALKTYKYVLGWLTNRCDDTWTLKDEDGEFLFYNKAMRNFLENEIKELKGESQNTQNSERVLNQSKKSEKQ